MAQGNVWTTLGALLCHCRQTPAQYWSAIAQLWHALGILMPGPECYTAMGRYHSVLLSYDPLSLDSGTS